MNATYVYRDSLGEVLYEIVRQDPKKFSVRRPDGNGGYVKGLGDVKPVPYHLPEVLNSAAVVFITEGEKDADCLTGFGLLSTTNAFGADKWTLEMSTYLVQRDVVVVLDNDGKGWVRGAKINESLNGLAKSVKIVSLPGVKDVSDFFAAGFSFEEFQTFVEATPFEAPPPEPEPTTDTVDLTHQSLSDYGNGQRLIAVHGKDARFCPPFESWFLWDSKRWKLDESGEIRGRIHAVMLAFVLQAVQSKDMILAKFAIRSLNSQRLTAALHESEPYLCVLPDALDTHPYLLNFENGIVDLRDGELLPHSRDYLITKMVRYAYVPTAQCPQFLAFVQRSVGSEMVLFLQKCLGYSLTGTTSEKLTFLCLGPTGTGKTTLLSLFRNLLGEYAVLILIDCLTQKTEDNNSRADLADLFGARLAVSSETEESTRLREAKLKRITQGQGNIKAVRKYENPFEFPETHKLWLDANHRPIVAGTDDAIWNRLAPISFDQPLLPCEIDKTLPDKLRSEAEGILNWTVAGARKWFSEGLEIPEQVKKTRGGWREEMDRLGAFRKECCLEGDVTYKVRARALYVAYRIWTEKAGEHPMTETRFGRRFAEEGVAKKRFTDGIYYQGICLRDWANPAHAKKAQYGFDDTEES
jgi:putative DNA primase/helicase